MRNQKTRVERFIDNSPLKITHYKIWLLSALGVFMDGLDLFIIAVALPFIDMQFHPNKWELGLIGAASPIGAILGAMMLGYLTDKVGRKKLYVGSMALFVIFSFLCAAAWSITALIVFRFLLGIGIGADYPISSTYLSEFMPKKLRSRAIISAFSFQAFGALSGAALGFFTLLIYPDVPAWRWMLGLTIVPAFIIGIMRTQLPESALWLQSKNQHLKAAQIVAKITGKTKPKTVSLIVSDKSIQNHEKEFQKKAFYYELFTARYIRQTLLTSVPWFIMDICLYGVGVFSAMILASVLGTHHTATTQSDYIENSIRAISGSVLLDVFLVVGFVSAIFSIKKLGTIRLQNLGFLGMTVGLLILSYATFHGQKPILVFVGFAIFNLMVNFGPNPTTYMLPTERFPPYIRASGHGFAASAGKIGAAIGIFFLPVFIKDIGISLSMLLLACCAMLGLICTSILGRKTAPHTTTNKI